MVRPDNNAMLCDVDLLSALVEKKPHHRGPAFFVPLCGLDDALRDGDLVSSQIEENLWERSATLAIPGCLTMNFFSPVRHGIGAHKHKTENFNLA